MATKSDTRDHRWNLRVAESEDSIVRADSDSLSRDRLTNGLPIGASRQSTGDDGNEARSDEASHDDPSASHLR